MTSTRSGSPDLVLSQVSAAAPAHAGAENFPVALRFVPARARRELLDVYTYARFVDDIGDGDRGGPATRSARLAALDAIADDVRRLPDAALPAVAALAPLAARRPEVPAALLDLVEANRVDQQVTQYESFDDLLGYCALSAAPVGRLVLAVAGIGSPSAQRASDDVCNALQVLEHCQDVGEDARRGRVYLPQADLRAAGVDARALHDAVTSPPLRHVVAVQVARSRRLLDSGVGLLGELSGWARIAVAGYIAGGRATAVALEIGDFGVLETTLRPGRRRTALEAAAVLVRAARTARTGGTRPRAAAR